MIADYFLLLIGAILVNNFVLVQFLGLCPFMGVSNKLESAMGMASGNHLCAHARVGIVSCLTYTWLLLPLGLGYLKDHRIYLGHRSRRAVHRNGRSSRPAHCCTGFWASILPLITTNCAVLGRGPAQSSANSIVFSRLCSLWLSVLAVGLLTRTGLLCRHAGAAHRG